MQGSSGEHQREEMKLNNYLVEHLPRGARDLIFGLRFLVAKPSHTWWAWRREHKSPLDLHSLEFLGFPCQSHMPPSGLAEHGLSPLQHMISTSMHLLRISQTEFTAGQREQKTCSSHTPYSFLTAFLVTRIHSKGPA